MKIRTPIGNSSIQVKPSECVTHLVMAEGDCERNLTMLSARQIMVLTRILGAILDHLDDETARKILSDPQFGLDIVTEEESNGEQANDGN